MRKVVKQGERQWRARAVVFCLLVLAADSANAQQKASPNIGDIQKAWQARQDRVRTARFTWKEKRTWPKGSISLFYVPAVAAKVPEIKGKTMPATDSTVDFSYIFTLDKDKVRLEYEGKEWDNVRQGFRPEKYLSAFNGKTARDVYPIGLADVDWPQGAIRKSERYRDAEQPSLLPLILLYRPFVPSLKPIDDLRGMIVTGQQKVLNGQRCVELMQQLSTSSIHIWVDPARDFVLARRQVIAQGKSVGQVDISYRNDESAGWVPTSWKTVSLHRNDKLYYSSTSEIASAEFDNRVESNTFDFDFPLGTWVLNERTGESYILRPDGTKRPVVGKEFSYTYEELLNSDPAEAHLPRAALTSYWSLAIAVTIGLSAIGIFVWRRLQFRRSMRREDR